MSADLGEGQSKMVPLSNVKQVEVAKGGTEFIGYDELSCGARILRYRSMSGKGGGAG